MPRFVGSLRLASMLLMCKAALQNFRTKSDAECVRNHIQRHLKARTATQVNESILYLLNVYFVLLAWIE